jgi:hypothetical protein
MCVERRYVHWPLMGGCVLDIQGRALLPCTMGRLSMRVGQEVGDVMGGRVPAICSARGGR